MTGDKIMACKHSDGSWHHYPERPENKNKFYSPHNECPTCGLVTSRYCKTHRCVLCSKLQSHAFYAWSKRVDNYLQVLVGGEPVLPEVEQWSILTELFQADPARYRVNLDPGKTCGHVGMVYATNGRCVMCRIEREQQGDTPRQRALKKGDKFYTPDQPCTICGTLSERSVTTGACKGCNGITRTEKPLSKRIQAQQRGEKWYESDDACECGKLLWKYVPNGRIRRCECGR